MLRSTLDKQFTSESYPTEMCTAQQTQTAMFTAILSCSAETGTNQMLINRTEFFFSKLRCAHVEYHTVQKTNETGLPVATQMNLINITVQKENQMCTAYRLIQLLYTYPLGESHREEDIGVLEAIMIIFHLAWGSIPAVYLICESLCGVCRLRSLKNRH